MSKSGKKAGSGSGQEPPDERSGNMDRAQAATQRSPVGKRQSAEAGGDYDVMLEYICRKRNRRHTIANKQHSKPRLPPKKQKRHSKPRPPTTRPPRVTKLSPPSRQRKEKETKNKHKEATQVGERGQSKSSTSSGSDDGKRRSKEPRASAPEDDEIPEDQPDIFTVGQRDQRFYDAQTARGGCR
jgi:hypothetical protein